MRTCDEKLREYISRSNVKSINQHNIFQLAGDCSVGRVNIDCYENTGVSYGGVVRVTRSGYECQYWNTTENYRSVGTHNYCRNTHGGAPWCYTVDKEVIWETCDVKICCLKGKDQPVSYYSCH